MEFMGSAQISQPFALPSALQLGGEISLPSST